MERHQREAKTFKVPKGKGGGRMRIIGFDDPHLRNSVRNLAYHRAVARKLRKPMVEEARHVLYRWREGGKINEHYARRWEKVLDQPVPEIRKAIVKESAEADDLRQNSPFAGQLSEAERRRILKEVV